MKLSDMFATLSRNAQEFEKRAAKWQEELGNRSEEMIDSAKTWMANAQKRDDDLKAQVKDYFNDASDQVKAQWETAKTEWDGEVAKLKAKSEEVRKKAETMQAEDTADWYEAYAANMVAYAQQVQDEAANAVAAANEARAKAEGGKTDTA
ncbi:hypothetical protein [Paracoccus albus]|uniref:hypothetical protein n=1 Tax=Paracoccus albus TaxID=3017784 RepID=UPI0022F088D2|nr:hypothetical protein [Paracoccus albus]WBU61824.1 hypothetical protein PAF20_08040 [Paracoccus albus]